MSGGAARSVVLFLALVLPMAATAQTPETESVESVEVQFDGAHLQLDETMWDFGNLSRRSGDVAKEFRFRNNGSKPLVITGITMSCTCIRVDYPKRPVGVGGSGTIKLTYEPRKSSPGVFYKVVQVHSNSVDGTRRLTVKGSAYDDK